MKAFFALLILSSISVISCKKQTTVNNATCKETPPTNELCEAAFQRWFYDQSTHTCEEISYSGCSMKGFASKSECADACE